MDTTLTPLSGDDNHLFYSLPKLEEQGVGPISRLPVSIRILLESLLRNCDGKVIEEKDIKALANWNAADPGKGEVPFVVARVILQDFTGVPLLVDLAAMRDAIAEKGRAPESIEPQVPVDLVVDHSVQVDQSGTESSFQFNLQTEFHRNKERYEFLKWGKGAFHSFSVVPPGIGIVHQVNLEHIATVVASREKNGKTIFFPDTLVGTDSHTTMINGLGVVGWGVGGIEAEAAMLEQPVFMQTPEVIGVHLSGKLREGVTATDLTLRITEMLRQENVVGKFVEYFGEGAASLPLADRATIGNMAPEYGATIGFFPVDEKTLDYLQLTGRDPQHIARVKEYLQAQGLFGIPRKGEVQYTKEIELDLASVNTSISGPKRPQDRISLANVKSTFLDILEKPVEKGGYGKGEEEAHKKFCVHSDGSFHLEEHHETGGTPELPDDPAPLNESEMVTNRPMNEAIVEPTYTGGDKCDFILSHGSVVIAAITSCTNTSNPSVMIGAGLLAKKAVEKGLTINTSVKTSLAPGSRVVTDYLQKTGLQKYLDQLGFNLVAYGCTTCIGNSGPLNEDIEHAIKQHDLITASVLSGNRNFEARIHGSVKANFLMSPPLVVAYALAGRIDIDMEKEPLGYDKGGKPVFLREIWPSSAEIGEAITTSVRPAMFTDRYRDVAQSNPLWLAIHTTEGAKYAWDPASTYIQLPPYFENFTLELPPRVSLEGMRPLALFGDSVTTDHISPAGAFKKDTPAGQYLLSKGVQEKDFNSYGSRRGNHHVMMRGTFANVRITNLLAGGKEGGFTKLMPENKLTTIFAAAEEYKKRGVPLIVFAGKDYGMGSSRDWAAKGTALLGVRAVIAQSYERIHRSNLIGMGVLPLQFLEGENAKTLAITGDEIFSIQGLEGDIQPGQTATLLIEKNGRTQEAQVLLRLDTPIEVEYYRHGGIMPYVLRQIIN